MIWILGIIFFEPSNECKCWVFFLERYDLHSILWETVSELSQRKEMYSEKKKRSCFEKPDFRIIRMDYFQFQGACEIEQKMNDFPENVKWD